MGGQKLLVCGEKVDYVSYSGHSYICANFECNNIVSDYDAKKRLLQKTPKRTRHEFCLKCKHANHKEMKLRCDGCQDGFNLSGKDTEFRKLCIECAEARKILRSKKANKNYRRRIYDKARELKKCLICNGPIPKHSSWLCSAKCALIQTRKLQKHWQRKRKISLKIGRRCYECKKLLHVHLSLGTKFCSKECIKIVDNRRRRGLIDPNRKCKFCYGPIIGRNAGAKYCCKKHAERGYDTIRYK